LEKYGKIDILVSNAATNPIYGDILSVRVNYGTFVPIIIN
jgi:hypothetical protein